MKVRGGPFISWLYSQNSFLGHKCVMIIIIIMVCRLYVLSQGLFHVLCLDLLYC